jgi:hypothetical protein
MTRPRDSMRGSTKEKLESMRRFSGGKRDGRTKVLGAGLEKKSGRSNLPLRLPKYPREIEPKAGAQQPVGDTEERKEVNRNGKFSEGVF